MSYSSLCFQHRKSDIEEVVHCNYLTLSLPLCKSYPYFQINGIFVSFIKKKISK